MRNAGADLHWEGQKRFFTLVEFAVFVGHPDGMCSWRESPRTQSPGALAWKGQVAEEQHVSWLTLVMQCIVVTSHSPRCGSFS